MTNRKISRESGKTEWKILTMESLSLHYFTVGQQFRGVAATFTKPDGSRGEAMTVDYTLDQTNSVLHVRPTGPLQESDFVAIAQAVDPFIEGNHGLNGLLLEVAHFPGWTNLAAAVQHFRFVRDHHRKIKKIAVVTDSLLGQAAEHIATHFVAATIRHFPSSHVDEARTWVASPPEHGDGL